MRVNFSKKKGYTIGLVFQVAIFFVLCVLVTGIMAYYTLKNEYKSGVKYQKETLAKQISKETENIVKSYPAWEWLLDYWYQNSDTLDVEYDSGEKTNEKAKDFVYRNRGFILSTASVEDIKKLTPEDQKIYAEIMYNWIIEAFNSITTAYNTNFLYCASVSEDYKDVVFIMNGSDGTRERGKEYGQAYILGVNVVPTEEQINSSRKAAENKDYMIISGDFIDKYSYLNLINNRHYFIGVTYDLKSFNEEVHSQTRTGIGFFVTLQIFLSILCLLLIYIFNIRPLKTVQSSVQKYGDDKDSLQAISTLKKIKSHNEIKALSNDVAEMIDSIETYINEIATINAEKERIAAELNVATKIQSDMLPSIFPPFPERKEIDIYASMNPAKEVGGDFYDFFFVDEKHIALVMADVSGKGVPAALFMVIAKVLIKNRMLRGDTPCEALKNVNNQLCEGNESGLFVTVWLALIDLETGEGLVTNAGHEHPVIKRKDGEFEIIKYKHSPAVAVMENMKFEEHSFKLNPGDRIFVYTDGVTEAQNVDKELFGETRMLQAVNKYKDCTIEEIVEGVQQSIDEYVNGATQFDDITMMTFAFNTYYKR